MRDQPSGYSHREGPRRPGLNGGTVDLGGDLGTLEILLSAYDTPFVDPDVVRQVQGLTEKIGDSELIEIAGRADAESKAYVKFGDIREQLLKRIAQLQ